MIFITTTLKKNYRNLIFYPEHFLKQFNIEVLSTTDSAISDLDYHIEMMSSDWDGKIIPTYRPDNVIDPET